MTIDGLSSKFICMQDLVCYIGRVHLNKSGLSSTQGPHLECPVCGNRYSIKDDNLISEDDKFKWPLSKCKNSDEKENQ